MEEAVAGAGRKVLVDVDDNSALIVVNSLEIFVRQLRPHQIYSLNFFIVLIITHSIHLQWHKLFILLNVYFLKMKN